jgi:hypothetical protein
VLMMLWLLLWLGRWWGWWLRWWALLMMMTARELLGTRSGLLLLRRRRRRFFVWGPFLGWVVGVVVGGEGQLGGGWFGRA